VLRRLFVASRALAGQIGFGQLELCVILLVS
jgi:hypothetical protein